MKDMIIAVSLSFASGFVVCGLYYSVKFDKALKSSVARSYRSGYNHCVRIGGRRRV